eukprot:tig00020830_g14395.t1
MSGWAAFCDILVKGYGVQAGSIYGKDGAKWCSAAAPGGSAATADFAASAAKTFAAGLNDPSMFAASGMVVGATPTKYMYLQTQPQDAVLGRPAVSIGSKAGVTVLGTQTNRAIITVVSKIGASPGNITSHTFVAQDLIKKGFELDEEAQQLGLEEGDVEGVALEGLPAEEGAPLALALAPEAEADAELALASGFSLAEDDAEPALL